MKTHQNKYILFFLFFVLITSFLTNSFAISLFHKKVEEKSKVEKHVLKNGLTVLIRESHSSKIVTLDIWVNTGSMNEDENINGVSHFLEHMMFKGTKTRGVGEIDKVIESVGGYWNAGTSRDFTHYYLTVASNYFDVGLDVLSDVIQNSVIAKDEFERERMVVIEEYRRKQDNPPSLLWEDQFFNSFKTGPYKLSVLGTPESLNKLTAKRMRQYYEELYTPDNMTFIICGDVIPSEILPKIEKAFEKNNRKLNKNAVLDTKTQWVGAINKEMQKSVGEVYLTVAYPAPSMNDFKEVCAMDLISTILIGGNSSKMYQNIKEKKQLVSTISSQFPTMKYNSIFSIFATCKPEKLDNAKKEILSEINNFVEKGPSRKELNKAKKIIINSYYFATETTSGQSEELGFYYTLTGDTDFSENYTKYIEEITIHDIKETARKYLNSDLANTYLIKPQK